MINRIIICLDVLKNKVVKGINFKKLEKFEKPIILIKKYKKIFDEIIFLNIGKEKIKNITKIIKKISKNIKIPITVGGNIKNTKESIKIFMSGADKICFNSTLYRNKNITKKISRIYGSQSIVASIDVKKIKKKWIVFIDGGKKKTNIEIIKWIKIQKENGVGEFLITNIERDGTNKGFDGNLIKKLTRKFNNTQFIFSGGGGGFNTIYDAFIKGSNSILLASIVHKKKIDINKIKCKLSYFFYIRK